MTLRRAATLTAAIAALLGASAPAADAQIPTGPTATTASPAPDTDAQETAAPRRRPVRRFRARTSPTPRSEARRDSIPMRSVSTRSSMEASALRVARLDRNLRDAAPRWLGIPYRWGGTSRRGIDCSAFVQQYVRENLAIELPRSTAGQRYEGVPVEQDELQSGDLVFFRRRGVRHVGVYLSDGEFIHASSSRGVTISELDNDYWTRYYWMARRIVTEPSGRMPLPRSLARRDSSGARG